MSNFNRIRSRKLSILKSVNRKRVNDIREYMKSNETTETAADMLLKLSNSMHFCANLSLYRNDIAKDELSLVTSIFCQTKTCAICNNMRKNATRRKYFKWFEGNRLLCQITNGKRKKVVTQSQFDKEAGRGYELTEKVPYNLMTLTLTMPHYQNGFNGELYYFRTIMELYKYLRNKCVFWDGMVYGGEFGVECTRGVYVRNKETNKYEYREQNNGLNIHIHSLLLVKPGRQNRNRLHKEIFYHWNRLTVNTDNPRTTFDDKTRALIKKGNALLDDDFIDSLNPQGATLIELRNIFTTDTEGGKQYNLEFNSKAMMKAVMETISYHFEPHAFDKQNETIDVPLLADILEHIHRERLYSKFGCLFGEKSLNLKDKPEDMLEEYDEVLETLIDEETGEINPISEHYIVNPVHVSHDPERDYRLGLTTSGQKYKRKLDVFSTRQAVSEMAEMAASRFNKQ